MSNRPKLTAQKAPTMPPWKDRNSRPNHVSQKKRRRRERGSHR
jgi:hypothetical protein